MSISFFMHSGIARLLYCEWKTRLDPLDPHCKRDLLIPLPESNTHRSSRESYWERLIKGFIQRRWANRTVFPTPSTWKICGHPPLPAKIRSSREGIWLVLDLSLTGKKADVTRYSASRRPVLSHDALFGKMADEEDTGSSVWFAVCGRVLVTLAVRRYSDPGTLSNAAIGNGRRASPLSRR